MDYLSLEKCKCIPLFVNYLRGLKLFSMKICRECFYSIFEEEIHNVIVDNKLFKPGERVAIAASGGKGESLISLCGFNCSCLVEHVYLDFFSLLLATDLFYQCFKSSLSLNQPKLLHVAGSLKCLELNIYALNAHTLLISHGELICIIFLDVSKSLNGT